MYLEPWHADVFEFIELRKNHGKEEQRARPWREFRESMLRLVGLLQNADENYTYHISYKYQVKPTYDLSISSNHISSHADFSQFFFAEFPTALVPENTWTSSLPALTVARDLFLGLWIPDLFMQRVKESENGKGF